jgi:hypothetical protein
MVEVDQIQKIGFPLKRAPPHIFRHGIFANPEEDLSQAGIESCRLPSYLLIFLADRRTEHLFSRGYLLYRYPGTPVALH